MESRPSYLSRNEAGRKDRLDWGYKRLAADNLSLFYIFSISYSKSQTRTSIIPSNSFASCPDSFDRYLDNPNSHEGGEYGES